MRMACEWLTVINTSMPEYPQAIEARQQYRAKLNEQRKD
jgi:hypothetical protein